MRKNYDAKIAALEATITEMQRERHNPRVNGWLSAIVATSPEAMDAVMFSFAGMAIGIPGALAATAFGYTGETTAQVWGLCTAGGVGLGTVRLGVAAVDLPLIIDGLAEKYFDWRDRRDKHEPQTAREVPIYSHNEQQTSFSMPAPTEFRVNTLTIPSVNIASGEREIAVDKVCLFLKAAVASGNWSRDTQAVLNKKEHPDVKAYLQGRGFWEITPPTLPRACAQLRGGGTNGTERDGTNEGTT